jgi:hypothetical protein
LRSRENGLCLSEALGRRFSGNGDMIGFTYNADEVINGVGFGSRKPQGREPVGPCVTGIIDARNKPDLDEGKVIEEASLPGAFALFTCTSPTISTGSLGYSPGSNSLPRSNTTTSRPARARRDAAIAPP